MHRFQTPQREKTSVKPRSESTPRSGATSLPNSIMQLQRQLGNQRTQQLLGRKPMPSKMIQPDRLVEIQSPGGKDAEDFDNVREEVQQGLGIASSGNWLVNTDFALGSDEVLYIWGHMTPEAIGTIEFSELAEILVERGFRTCAGIRLVGCNNQDNYTQAPTALWKALEAEFTERQLTEALKTIPTIYATKGPLYSGLKSEAYSFENWWVGTAIPKEDEIKGDFKKLERYYKGETVEEDMDYLVMWFEGAVAGFDLPITQENLPKLFDLLLHQKQRSIKQKTPDAYPSIKRPKEGEDGMEWNPDAWVSYP